MSTRQRLKLPRFFLTLFFSAVILQGIPAAAFAQGPKTGVVGVAHGTAKVITEDGLEKTLKNGDPIHLRDRLITGTGGHLQILLLDETVLTIGPGSAVKVDEFIYDPVTGGGKVKANILKGIFRVVSGKIAHQKPENMSVDLPAGSIGFRGTVVAGDVQGMRSLVVLLGSSQGEGGAPGRIFVANVVNGEWVGVEIDQGGYGTIIEGAGTAPGPVFEVSEDELSRIAGALRRGPAASGDPAGSSSGAFSASGPDVGDMEQLALLLSQMDDLGQRSLQGSMPQPVVPAPLPTGGRGDDDNNRKKTT